MLTEYYYNFIGGWFAFGSLIGSFPYRWLYKGRKVEASVRSEWMHEFFIFMFFIPYYILQTIKVIWFQINGDFNSLTILYIAWVFSTAILAQAVVQLYKLSELRQTINRVNDYFNTFKVSFIRKHDKRTLFKMRILDALLTLGIICVLLGVSIGGLHHAIFPNDPAYVGSLMAEEDLQIPLVYFTFVSVYTFGLLFMLLLAFVQVIAMLIFMYVLALVLLPEFQTGRPVSHYGASGTLRTFQVLPLQYRCLQLLHAAYLDIGSCLILPLQTLGTNHILFCNFILLTKWGTMKDLNKLILLLMALVGIVVIGGLLDCAGKLSSIGEATLKSWKVHNWGIRWRNNYMTKFRRSCKPIRIHYGNSYTIRKLTVLKFLRGLVRGTFRSLLALKK